MSRNRPAIIVALIVCGLFLSQRTGSGQALTSTKWLRLGGPLGGIGYDIKMRPDNPDIMYVTDANTGVHKSIDGGTTWNQINTGIEVRTGDSGDLIPAFCVTIDPNNYDAIWVGLQGQTGIYRSADGGQNWQRRTQGITETNGFTVRGITVQPGNSSIVYAAGEIGSFIWAGRQIQGKEFDKVKGVVYKSTDSGQNWQAVWRGDNLARYIIIDPTNVNTVYVSTGIFDREAANSDAATNTAGGVGILKSTDAGRTWSAINNGLRNLYIGTLFMHPQDQRILLAGASNISYRDGGGLYMTVDGGDTWRYVIGSAIQSVEFSTKDPKVAYATGQTEFYRSDDGGENWRAYLSHKRGLLGARRHQSWVSDRCSGRSSKREAHLRE